MPSAKDVKANTQHLKIMVAHMEQGRALSQRVLRLLGSSSTSTVTY